MRLAALFLGFACAAFGAACPTSGNGSFSSNCRYIAANGNDSNDGLSEANGHPWAHAPGMPNCTANCAADTPGPGKGYIFRGGDTWHFGNGTFGSSTGGTWQIIWGGTPSSCQYGGTMTGCIYWGVDPNWPTSGWARPIMTGDNPLCNSSLVGVAGCTEITGILGGGTSYRVSSCAYSVGSANAILQMGFAPSLYYNWVDNFEFTGHCATSPTNNSADHNVMLNDEGSGVSGDGMLFWSNLYFHGWSADLTAGTEAHGSVAGCQSAGDCFVPGYAMTGGNQSLESIWNIVVDGSDSNDMVFSWSFGTHLYHFKDSIVRYATQGVTDGCHDMHDLIFEHMDIPDVPTHGNVLECNVDSNTSAGYPNQPANTPNVVYNNIFRHDSTRFPGSGNPDLWLCPNTTVEYWFNNLLYDLGGEFWSIAGPAQYPSCPNSGGQFMFNNTLVDGFQPCSLQPASNGTNGQYLTILNEHAINAPLDTFESPGCTGRTDASNIFQSDSTATSQGYTTGSAGSSQANNCANDSTTPCSPIASNNSTVGAGGNHQAYCTTLASFTQENAISTEAANACKFGTTDGCTYSASAHSMSCPAQTAIPRPVSGAWDSGAYEFSTAIGPASLGPWTNTLALVNVTMTCTACPAATWSATSLPTGLSIAPSTGQISGTISALGPFPQNFNATVSYGSVNRAYTIVVNAVPSIASLSLPNATVGTAYSQSLSPSGGTSPVTCAVTLGSLPPGTPAFSVSPCSITGTPTTAGTYNFTAAPTDSLGIAGSGVSYTLVVSAASTSTPVVVNTTACPAGSVYPAACTIPATQAGDRLVVMYQSYTSAGGTCPSASANNCTMSSVTATGATFTDLGTSVNTAGGNNSWNDIQYATNIPAGITSVTITPSTTQNGDAYIWEIKNGSSSPSCTQLSSQSTTTTPSGPSLTVGTNALLIAFLHPNAASNPSSVNSPFLGTAACDLTGCINDGMAWASYSPASAGTYGPTWNMSPTGTFSAGSCSLTAGSSNASVSPTSLGPWTNTQVITGTSLTGSGFTGTITWSQPSGTVPPGLGGTCISGTTGSTCTLTGTLSSSAGSPYAFTIRATDGTNTVNTPFNVTVNGTPTMTTLAGALPAATQNVLYTDTLTGSGGTGGLTFAITSGSLTGSGLSMNSAGVISGTASGTGPYSITVTPTDVTNSVSGAGVNYTLQVNAATTGIPTVRNATFCGPGATWPGSCIIPATASGSTLVVMYSSYNSAGGTCSGGLALNCRMTNVSAGVGGFELPFTFSYNNNSGNNAWNDVWIISSPSVGTTSVSVQPSTTQTGDVFVWEVQNATAVAGQSINSQPASANAKGALANIRPMVLLLANLHPGAVENGNPTGVVAPFMGSSTCNTSGCIKDGMAWASYTSTINGSFAPVWTQSPQATFSSVIVALSSTSQIGAGVSAISTTGVFPGRALIP